MSARAALGAALMLALGALALGATRGSASRAPDVADDSCAVAVPTDLPAGWQPYTGFGCDAPLFVPGADSAAIAAPTWEACPAGGFEGVGCRRLHQPDGAVHVAAPGWFTRAADGTPLLAVAHAWQAPGRTEMVVITPPDGPARLAVAAGPGDFAISLQGLSGDAYAFGIIPDRPGTEHGVVAGRLSEPAPRLAGRMPDVGELHASWQISEDALVRNLDRMTIRGWTDDAEAVVYDRRLDPDRLPAFHPQIVGDAVVFAVNADGLAGVMSWTPRAGLRPLLRHVGDRSRVAVGFGTDGTDMVWVDGEGVRQTGYTRARMTVMTAPFSTDPDVTAATARPLGASPAIDGPARFEVGCGHAAIQVSGRDGQGGLEVVRLADGARALLRPAAARPYPVTPLGITCEEVFALDPQGVPLRLSLAAILPRDARSALTP